MRPPDLQDKAQAWIIPIDRSRKDWSPNWEGTLCLYLVQCKWSHPAWSWYHITGIHLRDIPGVKPAVKHFPEASHEIVIMSLDPEFEHDPDKLASGENRVHFLTPFDLEHQVGGLTDDQFKSVVQDCVVAIVEGRMSPDQDYRSRWERLIDLTAKHIREGKHRPQ